jgi:hypothetical protein
MHRSQEKIKQNLDGKSEENPLSRPRHTDVMILKQTLTME